MLSDQVLDIEYYIAAQL